MKHFVLLITCLGLSFSSIAQRKNEFGVVLKTGNFTIGSSKFEASTNLYESGSSVKTTIHPGISVAFGGFYTLRLGTHFSLSAELLYRHSNYSRFTDTKYTFRGVSGQFQNEIKEIYILSENCIALPVKIQYSFLKNGKTSLTLGAGLSRMFSVEQNKTDHFVGGSTNFKGVTSTFIYKDTNWRNFENMLSFTAGIFQRIDNNNRIGLEFTFEGDRKFLQDRFKSNLFIDDVIEYRNSYIITPNLQNIAVSLYHNLL